MNGKQTKFLTKQAANIIV